MWFDTSKFKPSGEWLRRNKYVPDSVWTWANGDGPGWARLDYFLEGKMNTAHPMHAALWAPIEMPGQEGFARADAILETTECNSLDELEAYVAGMVHASDLLLGRMSRRIGEMRENAS